LDTVLSSSVINADLYESQSSERTYDKVEFKSGQDVWDWARASRDKDNKVYHIGSLHGDIDPKWPFCIKDYAERETQKDIVEAVLRDLDRGLITIKQKRLTKSMRGIPGKFAYIAERLTKVKYANK
jgi:hypothetical protein